MWLQDGLAIAQQPQMLGHHVEIIAGRVQGRDVQFLALLPIIAVIIVRTKHRGKLIPKNLGDASTERGLPSSTVSHNPQDNRTRRRCNR